MENDGDGDDQNISENTPKAHDPGWNDPPKLTYGALGQTKFVKKGLLNKRVAFPLNANAPTAPSTSSLSATPLKNDNCPPFASGDSPVDTSKSSSHKPFIVPVSISNNDPLSPKNDAPVQQTSKPASEPKMEEENRYEESSLETVINILEKIISELMTPKNSDKNEVDIRKRLEVMKKMWSEGKLSGAVQEKMLQLANALQKGEGSLANDLHIEMIVDHTSEVTLWMAGIRKLVHRCMLAAERANKAMDLTAKKSDEPPQTPHQTADADEDKSSE